MAKSTVASSNPGSRTAVESAYAFFQSLSVLFNLNLFEHGDIFFPSLHAGGQVGGEMLLLGKFSAEEDAARKYDEVASELLGDKSPPPFKHTHTHTPHTHERYIA